MYGGMYPHFQAIPQTFKAVHPRHGSSNSDPYSATASSTAWPWDRVSTTDPVRLSILIPMMSRKAALVLFVAWLATAQVRWEGIMVTASEQRMDWRSIEKRGCG